MAYFADEIARLSSSAETRGQVDKLKATAASYEASAQKLAAIKTELLEIAAAASPDRWDCQEKL